MKEKKTQMVGITAPNQPDQSKTENWKENMPPPNKKVEQGLKSPGKQNSKSLYIQDREYEQKSTKEYHKMLEILGSRPEYVRTAVLESEVRKHLPSRLLELFLEPVDITEALFPHEFVIDPPELACCQGPFTVTLKFSFGDHFAEGFVHSVDAGFSLHLAHKEVAGVRGEEVELYIPELLFVVPDGISSEDHFILPQGLDLVNNAHMVSIGPARGPLALVD